jgi:hypothetical protein
MSILARWAVPLGVALLTGALLTLLGRSRRSSRRPFEEIEHFQRFRDAMERPPGVPARRRPRSTA